MRISKKKLYEELNEIIPKIKLSESVTPKNDYSQRKKFIAAYNKGEVYNPQYKYKKKQKKLQNLKDSLLNLRQCDLDKYNMSLIRKLLLHIDFIDSIGGDENQVYTNGKPDSDMVALAKELIPKKKGRMQKRILVAKEAKTSFMEYLSGFGIRDWKVVIKKKMIAKASVDPSKKILFIKDRKYSFHEVNNLISHEIAVHILRAVNGYRQKNPLFYLGTGDYLRTEEGLAIMMEQLTGNYSEQRFKFFCARIIAADMSLSKSFYHIFNALHKKYNLSKHNAYIITKRAKRGMVDTSLPGGYIKDHVYFEGFQMIRKFMQEGGDIRPLFAGKIALSERSLVKKESIKKDILVPLAVGAHYNYRAKQTLLM
ncbi:DUF1704 domain-containing protein [Candidatus Woesearchaeota archaeon]|nr:DUF1704 domain-containing protein [Candidatus Woesearchaeota archaeon]